MPPPARHGHLLEAAYKVKLDVIQPEEFGFLTNKGEFVDRITAKKIVKQAGQKVLERASYSSELFSEDLW